MEMFLCVSDVLNFHICMYAFGWLILTQQQKEQEPKAHDVLKARAEFLRFHSHSSFALFPFQRYFSFTKEIHKSKSKTLNKP